jgi:septal ring-binding cell division protein DamX/type II secretory pathway predicted ATPase ExeA
MAEAERGFLGLTHNPFVQSDEGFFEQADRKTHLEALRHLSQWSRRVLLVTGPQGIGKSVLYRQLSNNLEPRCKAARIYASLINASREVLASVAQGFGIAAPSGANAQLLTSLIERHVEAQSAAERICVVMVDDADRLEPKAVVDLMTLAAACNLQLVLFGEAKLVPAIERSAGRVGLGWHEIRLEGFTAQQTREYLEWRFQQARYRGRLPFTETQVKEIQRLSDGIPGKINQMANVLLVNLETGDIGRSASVFPALHRALLGLLLVVAGLLYLLWRQSEDAPDVDELIVAAESETRSSAAELPVEAMQELPLEEPPARPRPADPRQMSGSSIASQPADGIPFGQQPVFPEPAAQTDTDTLTAGGADPAQATPATGEPERQIETAMERGSDPGTLATPIAQPLDPQLDDTLQPAATAAPEAPGARQPLPEVVPESEAAGLAVEASVAVAAESLDETAESLAEAAEGSLPIAAEGSLSAEGSLPIAAEGSSAEGSPRDAEWLLAQPGDWFTLQLVSVSSAERAAAFMERQAAPQQFASYELERDGRRLHVVVYGLFATRSEADAASRSLPAGVGSVKPWVRSMEQVHGAIYTVR